MCFGQVRLKDLAIKNRVAIVANLAEARKDFSLIYTHTSFKILALHVPNHCLAVACPPRALNSALASGRKPKNQRK